MSGGASAGSNGRSMTFSQNQSISSSSFGGSAPALDHEAKKKYEEKITDLEQQLISANNKMIEVTELLSENKDLEKKNKELEDANRILTE